MPTDKPTLKSEFDSADGQRATTMARCRECSELTIPSVLPPIGTTGESEIKKPYQSLGSSGVSNMTNKLLLALYPVGTPWWRFTLSANVRSGAEVSEAAMVAFNEVEQRLFIRELLVMRQLEQARLRTRKRTNIEHLVVVGNTLSMLTDEYKLRIFRLDQYVQKKSSEGEVLWLITHEKADPLQLTDEQLARAKLRRADLMKKSVNERALDLYTKVEKQRSKSWLIQQEINGEIVNESEEPVTRYFPSGYVELPGEDYSRGFIEERVLGSLRSYNGLTKAILDATLAVAKCIIAADETSGLTPEDLQKPNLSIIVARVTEDHGIKGAGILKMDKMGDLTVAGATRVELRQELSSAMLMESSMQPQKDRVTATQVLRIAQELEGATGGVYSQIAEEEQLPLIERIVWQMKKDKKLPALPDWIEKETDIEILTGVEALGRMREADAVRGLIQDIGQNQELMRYIKPEWLIQTYVRGYSIDARGAVKSQDEIDAENAKMAEMQAKLALVQQGIQTGGAIVQEAAKQGPAA